MSGYYDPKDKPPKPDDGPKPKFELGFAAVGAFSLPASSVAVTNPTAVPLDAFRSGVGRGLF